MLCPLYDESIRNVFRGIICSFAANDNNNNNLANNSSHIPNILNKHFQMLATSQQANYHRQSAARFSSNL